MRHACGSKLVGLVYPYPAFDSANSIIPEVAWPISNRSQRLVWLRLNHESMDCPADSQKYQEESHLPTEHGFENHESVGVDLAEHPAQPTHIGEVEQAPVCAAEADEQRSYKHRIGQSPKQDVVGCGPVGGMAELIGRRCVMHSA